jgi:hypothetical protein
LSNSNLVARPVADVPVPRDLEADLVICEAATPGPYRIWRCDCGRSACDQYFISVTNSDGRLDPQDAKFYSEARTGWPYAIRRAMEAEAENAVLRKKLLAFEDQERGIRCPFD